MFDVEITVLQGGNVRKVRRSVSATELQSLRSLHGTKNVALIISLEALEAAEIDTPIEVMLSANAQK